MTKSANKHLEMKNIRNLWSNLLAVGAFYPSAGASKNLANFRSSLVESHAMLLKQLDQSLKELEKAWSPVGWGWKKSGMHHFMLSWLKNGREVVISTSAVQSLWQHG